jgi:F-box protein 9
VPIGAVLETVYYRYLYFQEDGRVLYALTSAPPHEIFRRFRLHCLGQKDKDAVWGTYQVQKRQVVVTAQQEWQWVRLELTIASNNVHGRYGYLSFDRHVSSTDEFEKSKDRVEYEVPSEPFRFVQDKRL